MKWQSAIVGAVLCLVFTCGQESNPAETDEAFPLGKVIRKVICAQHPEQSYALYLPGAYEPEKRWPIVYVFDPAARGPVPTELMKDAAEQFGYIIATSNNSKNGPWKPEFVAATSMWDDTHKRLSIDDRRIYLAGFSGGARVASRLQQLCKCAHGVFLSGAGFSTDSPPSRGVTFPVFMTAGMLDFNYRELSNLDPQLAGLGYPHFLRRFDGAHEWAPAAVWPEALSWMNLQAMKEKRLDRDDAFIGKKLQRFTAEASEV